MKPAKLEIVPYQLPLRAPVRIANADLHSRKGFLLRMASEAGVVGWGDAAPLPGFSRESSERVFAELEELGRAACSHEFHLVDDLHAWSASLSAYSSSARFAVESAIAELAASEANQSIGVWLFGASADRCEVNALIVDEPEAWAGRTRECAADGYTTIKFKVGRYPIAQELAGLRAAIGSAPELRFRLDANRAWSVLTARAVATEIASLSIEFIEEPFQGGGSVPATWPRTVGIAWDETLHGDGSVPDPVPPTTAWVLKPTLAGGLSRCVQLANQAQRCGCGVVFSSAYESGVGVRMLAELAAATGRAAGLDPYRVLAEDILEPQLEISAGVLDLVVARRSVVKR